MSGSFPGLDGYLADEGPRVEAALERALVALDARTRSVADADAKSAAVPSGSAVLEAEVRAAIRHGVTGGGKRLRPVLCVAAYDACGGGRPDEAYDLAAALEMIHAYSLMHDDLPCMDDAALRRGRSTTHREYGEDVTMRAGAALIPAAALQSLSACAALGVPDARSRAVTRAVLEAAGAGGMVGGQWLDLLGEGRALRADELDALHRMKTGALLTASLVVGALAAGADDSVRTALETYGRAIGLAFQIADDVLDATQDAETLGKNPSDATLDKSTYVALYGLDEARTRAAAEIDRALGALREARLKAPALEALARYVIDRGK